MRDSNASVLLDARAGVNFMLLAWRTPRETVTMTFDADFYRSVEIKVMCFHFALHVCFRLSYTLKNSLYFHSGACDAR
jgi:hypothetical protein